MSLQTIHKKLEDAIASGSKTLQAKAKTASIEEIRYTVGILDGLQLAKQAIQDSIAKGGE